MNILMTGATGFVGKHLSHQLIKEGHKLKILTRNKNQSAQNIEGPITYFQWRNPESETPPQEAFKDIDAVINLMGENLSEKGGQIIKKKKDFQLKGSWDKKPYKGY